MDKERRRFKRFDAYMNVNVTTEKQKKFQGISLSNDLSREGMKISSNTTVSIGSQLDLEINIPDDPKPVYSSAKVMWVKQPKETAHDYQIGIKFSMMDPVDKFRVLDYAYNNWLETTINDFQDAEEVSEI